MRKALIGIVCVLVIFGGLRLAAKKNAPKPPPPNTQQIQAKDGMPVRTSRIVTGDMEESIELTGSIGALNRVVLSPKTSGRIAQVLAREGDVVSKGAVYVTLDQEDALSNVRSAEAGLRSAYTMLSQAKTGAQVTKIGTDAAVQRAEAAVESARAQLAVAKQPRRTQERVMAEADLSSAKAQMDEAEAEYKRYQKLLKEGAISQSMFDSVQTRYTSAKSGYSAAQQRLSLIDEGGRAEDIRSAQSGLRMAEEGLREARANSAQNLSRREDIKAAEAGVERAKAALDLARQQLSYTRVTSPISGKLAFRSADPGMVVMPGQNLGEVVDLGSLYFEGSLSETDFGKVRPGQSVSVTVDALAGEVFEGTIGAVYPAGSTKSRNFPVRVRIRDGSGLVRPAMFARGWVTVGFARDVLLVPKDAIDDRKGTKLVFTVDQKKRVAKRHEVRVVRENLNYVQIAQPTDLKLGDVVVTEGRQGLNEGTKVYLGK